MRGSSLNCCYNIPVNMTRLQTQIRRKRERAFPLIHLRPIITGCIHH
jgi:hypothetical protein